MCMCHSVCMRCWNRVFRGWTFLSLTHEHMCIILEWCLCFVGLEVFKNVDVYVKQECIALIVPFLA